MKHVTQPATTTEEAMFHFVVRKLIEQGRPALAANGKPALQHHSDPDLGCSIRILWDSVYRSMLDHTPSSFCAQLQSIHDGPAKDPRNFVAGVKAQARRVAAFCGFSLPLEAL